jgi:hypothetical protein
MWWPDHRRCRSVPLLARRTYVCFCVLMCVRACVFVNVALSLETRDVAEIRFASLSLLLEFKCIRTHTHSPTHTHTHTRRHARRHTHTHTHTHTQK